MHRFASLGLKSRIDAGSSRSSARTLPARTLPAHPPAYPPAYPPARVSSRVEDASCLGCLHGAGTTQVCQWRRKRVLMRPEAAFPYVFAAEGAQHPPKKPPRSTTLAAAPAQKAATLNASSSSQHPPRSTYLLSTRPTRLHANSFCRISSHRHWCRTVCVSLQGAP